MRKPSDAERAIRADLAAAHRLCQRERFVEGLWNHISYAVTDSPLRMLVTPNHVHWSQVRATGLLLVDADGKVLEGRGRPNASTAIIHTPIHEARPDARCLIHVHATYSTALFMRRSITLETRGSQAALEFHGRVAYFDVYDGPLYYRSEGERMAQALGDKDVLVLRNHGILVAAATVADAFGRLYAFERACQLQALSQPDQQALNLIPEAVIDQIRTEEAREAREARERGEGDINFDWLGWRALLDATEPDYTS